jgi:hypothetical protein
MCACAIRYITLAALMVDGGAKPDLVSYRDDHAAALARAEALEAELARTVAERDRLRVELARTRAQRFPLPMTLPLPTAMYVRPARASAFALALRAGVLVAIIGAAVLAMTAVHQPARATHVELAPVPEPVAPLSSESKP